MGEAAAATVGAAVEGVAGTEIDCLHHACVPQDSPTAISLAIAISRLVCINIICPWRHACLPFTHRASDNASEYPCSSTQ